MPRPCEPQHPLSPDTCRLCWLSLHDSRYQRLWQLPITALDNPLSNGAALGHALFSRSPVLGITPCKHFGPATGRVEECPSCGGSVKVKVFSCGIHGECTTTKAVSGVACCNGCPDYAEIASTPTPAQVSLPSATTNPIHSPKWVYGVTTVPQRRTDLLPRTLTSLAKAGFYSPRLFVDDCDLYRAVQDYQRDFLLETTVRHSKVRAAANWILSLAELYLRNPTADRYAIFQDDIVLSRNVRPYLDAVPWPHPRCYLNLMTFPSNDMLAPRGKSRFYRSNQLGRSACALVFDNEGVVTLLSQRHLWYTVRDKNRGHRSIDGRCLEAMKAAGYEEWVHKPSLVQHVGGSGMESAIGKDCPIHREKVQCQAPTFMGEDFNCLDLLKVPQTQGVK